MWIKPSGIWSRKCTRLFSPVSAVFAAFRRAPCRRCQDQEFLAETLDKTREACDNNLAVKSYQIMAGRQLLESALIYRLRYHLFDHAVVSMGSESAFNPAKYRSITVFDSLKLAEIADVALKVTYRQSVHQPSCSNIRSEGNRRGHPQRDISLNKTEKTRKLTDLSISENGTQRSSNQDEIIALFKRIQVSISRGQSTSSRRTNRNITREKKPAKSLLGTFRRYPRKKQTKAQSLEEIKGSPQSSNTLKDESSRGSGSSRPLSRFVKKSPIPQISSKENTKKGVEEKASETDAMFELQKLEGMKLIELKELAKAKGVKGFSKLKKRELLELLKEVWKSS